MKPILAITKQKGIIFGYTDCDLTSKTLSLTKARTAINWGTTKGFMQLANTGPTRKSVISSEGDIPVLHDVLMVVNVTPEAEEAWKSA